MDSMKQLILFIYSALFCSISVYCLSSMKSPLKNILNNRIALLGILDVLVIFWIIWNEGQIQYEPPIDYREIIYPLEPNTYNTIIVTIIVNIIVMINEIKRLSDKTLEKANLKVAVIYIIFIICSLTCGYFHITSRTGNGVISECNALFAFPLMLFGKKDFVSVITVTNLYLSLCIIHISSCIVYISRLLSR